MGNWNEAAERALELTSSANDLECRLLAASAVADLLTMVGHPGQISRGLSPVIRLVDHLLALVANGTPDTAEQVARAARLAAAIQRELGRIESA